MFDRVYHREERKFGRARLVEMEEVVTNDPKRFWDMLGKLGSRKSQEIPMEIVDENGVLINDINTVLSK